MVRRKMTQEEAEALGLVPFMDYYEFGDDGTCLSLRDGGFIGGADGRVSLSGRIRSTNVRMIKVVAAMYLGLRDFKNTKLLNADDDLNNNAVGNIVMVPMSEWLGQRELPGPRKPVKPRGPRYIHTKTAKQQFIQAWYRNNI